ncbi:MAG: TRAP transporter substrate-binding protein [Peptostreptococcaceae bacterium]
MKVGKRIALLLITATIGFGAIGCSKVDGAEKKARVIRVAHGQNEEHPQHKAMEQFEKYVEEKTNGELDVQIFPNELLGASAQALELSQTGAIDLVIASLGNLEAFNKSYTVLNLPYIMDSTEHYHQVMNDEEIIGPIFESTRKSGFIGLTWFDAGVRNIYTTKKPILKPEDLKGLKIRVQTSPTNVKMLQALGASATPMSFGEVYTGLQQNVIDGAENNELALINNKHGEVAKHYSYNMHAMLPDILVANADLLDKLTPEQAQAIRDGAKFANEYEVELWEDAAAAAKEKAEEMGVQFYYPDIKPFQEKMENLHKEYTQDESMKTVFDKIRAKGDEILAQKEKEENK